jgi:hypothetical protein
MQDHANINDALAFRYDNYITAIDFMERSGLSHNHDFEVMMWFDWNIKVKFDEIRKILLPPIYDGHTDDELLTMFKLTYG